MDYKKNTGCCLPQYIDDTSSSLFNQMDIPYEFGKDGDVFRKWVGSDSYNKWQEQQRGNMEADDR